ncbi:Inverted formin-2 [Geodia barretti]|uniref:Inverted formin-2 n=1 Tax=Geodia barretti TaxID=519541 RepID=A0AA35WDF0_GEOBA|nr:Inverted formin-2 [Geodia barretti]
MADEAGIFSSAAFSTVASNGATPTGAPGNGEEGQMSWKLARKALIKAGSPGAAANGDSAASHGGSLEGADPELCITLLERGLNFSGLKARLKAADQAWMEHFITVGGIPALFDALETLGRKGFSGIVGAIRQLECVGCVRAVMNNRFGLEFIVEARGESFVKRLTDVLDTNNALVKIQVFELLSALCVYSPHGHQLALEALKHYKRTKCQRYRFSLLLQEIKNAETHEYAAVIMAFINCIITGAPDLGQRLALRNEFIAMQLLDVLAPMRSSAEEALATQIEVFEDSHHGDQAQLEMPGDVDISSHSDLFTAVFARVRERKTE